MKIPNDVIRRAIREYNRLIDLIEHIKKHEVSFLEKPATTITSSWYFP